MSDRRTFRHVLLALAAAALLASAPTTAQAPRFLLDDPVAVDDDRLVDVGEVEPLDLSQQLDFLANTFAKLGDRRDIRALNVNTLDEVPDSSWFTNRIAHRLLSDEELRRGPDEFDALPYTRWRIVAGKSSGLQPGFRAVAVDDPSGQLYQIEFDPPGYPDLATGAEMVGTGIYHALGYNVVENYLVQISTDRLEIAPTATTRDRAGRRVPFTPRHLREVLDRAHRDDDGTYRALASRFAPGTPAGNFRYYGTRPDDPNDIYPHEHRRELRGARVFAAWVNHDDSRAVNTLDMVEGEPGRRYVRHYMFDFGSIMGSGTVAHDAARSGHAYLIERAASLRTLATFGLWAPAWAKRSRPEVARSAGPFHADDHFDPVAWRAEYPNVAFQNMRADDAFWAARRVAAFTDAQLDVLVRRGAYRDPAAHAQIVAALIARRDAIARAWLTGVTPVAAPALSADGRLTFEDAAAAAGVTAGARYRVQWQHFDNDTGTHTPVGDPVVIDEPRTLAPEAIRAASGYVAASVSIDHPGYPAWQRPAVLYFRRTADSWQAVGLVREVPPRDAPESPRE